MPSPSASAAPRMRFARMAPAASGLRPIASLAFAVASPTPMPGPRTPKPTAIPAASPANSTGTVLLLLRGVRVLLLRKFGMRDMLCVCLRRMLLVVFPVAFQGEHEVHEDEQAEDEALNEADEDLEAGERDREPRQEKEPAHDDEHDLAAEHVAPKPERERGHAEELAEELDEPDQDHDHADEGTFLESAEVEPPGYVREAELSESVRLIGHERDERHAEVDVVVARGRPQQLDLAEEWRHRQPVRDDDEEEQRAE